MASRKFKVIEAFFLAFALIILAFASFVSSGNYRFQDTSGSDLMFINGSTGSVGIGAIEA